MVAYKNGDMIGENKMCIFEKEEGLVCLKERARSKVEKGQEFLRSFTVSTASRDRLRCKSTADSDGDDAPSRSRLFRVSEKQSERCSSIETLASTKLQRNVENKKVLTFKVLSSFPDDVEKQYNTRSSPTQ